MDRNRLLTSLLVVIGLAGCANAGAPSPTPTATPSATQAVETPSTPAATAPASLTPTPSPPPTPPLTPTPTSQPTQAYGTPSAGCINGWIDPPDGSAAREEGLELLAGSMGVEGPFEVVETRYFIGPDVPWIIEPHYENVQRWYIKASLASDPGFRGRWLLEERSETVRGISGVAPFDSHDFTSPDWVGFFGEGPATVYEGLPGAWFGIPYDFVTGEGDSGYAGLPTELLECLTGS